MYFVTYVNIWLKCYITFCDIVADGKRGSNVLANAIAKFNLFLINKKNIKNRFYCFLFTVTLSSSSSAETIQTSLSFADKFSAFAISPGIVVLKDFECGACRFAVDSTSNNFIPPYLLFFINIFVNILYICCLHIFEM